MSNLQYLPPDFEQRCGAYRAALDGAYASGSLDDAGRLRLEQERKRIKLRVEDANELEDAYLRDASRAVVLLERRLQAQFEAILEHSRELERRRLSDAAQRFRGIEADIAALNEQLEQTQRLRQALDRLGQEIARAAQISSPLPRRLDAIEAHQRKLSLDVQRSQARSASQAESLTDLEQRLQATLANQTQLRDEVQEALADTQAEISALLSKRLRAIEIERRDSLHEMQRLQARTTATHSEIRALQQGLRATSASQTQLSDGLQERLHAIEAHQSERQDEMQRLQARTATQSEIRALQQALRDTSAS